MMTMMTSVPSTIFFLSCGFIKQTLKIAYYVYSRKIRRIRRSSFNEYFLQIWEEERRSSSWLLQGRILLLEPLVHNETILLASKRYILTSKRVLDLVQDTHYLRSITPHKRLWDRQRKWIMASNIYFTQNYIISYNKSRL